MTTSGASRAQPTKLRGYNAIYRACAEAGGYWKGTLRYVDYCAMTDEQLAAEVEKSNNSLTPEHCLWHS